MSEHSEAIASEVKDALEIADVVTKYFLHTPKWRKLREDRPKRCLPHVEEAAVDIGQDMLVTAGWYFDEEVAEFSNALLTMFETGFLYGAAFQEDPSNHPKPLIDRGAHLADPSVYMIGDNGYRLVGEGLGDVFIDMMDKAYDALTDLASQPANLTRKGAYDMAVSMLQSILSADEKDAYWVVLEYAIWRGAQNK